MSEDFGAESPTPGVGPDRFGWSQRCVDGAVVVLLAGELDLSTAAEFRRRLRTVAESAAARIVLDLSAVSFIDAQNIGVIVAAWSAAKTRGRQLCVDGLHDLPAQLFRVLGLEPMLGCRMPAADLERGGDG